MLTNEEKRELERQIIDYLSRYANMPSADLDQRLRKDPTHRWGVNDVRAALNRLHKRGLVHFWMYSRGYFKQKMWCIGNEK